MKDKNLYIRNCHTVMPNNDDSQEIYVSAELYDGREITMIFTPDDFIDTFTPTLFEQVKRSYIKYLKEKH